MICRVIFYCAPHIVRFPPPSMISPREMGGTIVKPSAHRSHYLRFLSILLLCVCAWLSLLGTRPASAAENNERRFDVTMRLGAQFVTLPDAPFFWAEGRDSITVQGRHEGAVIPGESIPRMVFQAKHPPLDLKALTVVIEGIPGTWIQIDWADYPTIRLTEVDLRVQAFDVPKNELMPATQPILDIVLSNISLSTEPIDVEGVTSAGYVDAMKLEVQVVGEALLPEDPHPLYTEWLANEPILLELIVRAHNPFSKK